MKRLRTELPPRLLFVATVLIGFLWFVNRGGLMLLIGILGVALTVWFVLKTKRSVNLGTFLGWVYWLLVGWKGASVRAFFKQAAQVWGGDGSSLSAIVGLVCALVITALFWKLAGVSIASIPRLSAFLKVGKASQKSDVDWQPVYFVLGEEKTEEKFRMGGE